MTKSLLSSFPAQAAAWLKIHGWKVAIVLATALWIYVPVLRGAWLSDDLPLFVSNPLFHIKNGLWYIWLGSYQDNEWPLTWTLVWLISQVFGLEPLTFHPCNLILHGCDAFLLWFLLARLGLKQAWLGALIFIVHPMMVETVAWMSEIKNTFSLLFYLLALLSWMDLEEGKGKFRYLFAFLFYLAALLSKSSVVMLPFVLLLFSWWKHGRVRLIDFGRILPFLCIGTILSDWAAHDQGLALADSAVKSRGFLTRIGQSGESVFFYLGRFFWPVGNMPIFPKWQIEPPRLWQLLTPVWLCLAGLFLLICHRQNWSRHCLLGFGFFLLNLAPVVGMANIVYYHVSWVADHLAYLPSLGLIGLSVAGFELIIDHQTNWGRYFTYTVVFSLASWCLFVSHGYALMWRNEFVLWDYAFKLNPASITTRRLHAEALVNVGRYQESVPELRMVLKDHPEEYEAQQFLAEALSNLPNATDETMAEYQKLVSRPDAAAEDFCKFGMFLTRLGRTGDAIEKYRLAIKLNPNYADAHGDLGFALMNLPGHETEAFAEYATALQLDPTDPLVHNNLGYAYLLTPGKLDAARSELELAIKYRPNFGLAYNNLGNVWAKQGSWDNAIDEYQAAAKIDPNDPMAHRNLAFIYTHVLHDWVDALSESQTLARLEPHSAASQILLGNAFAYMENYEDACKAYKEALRLDPTDPNAAKNLQAIQAKMPPR
jgi:protein O-mannosyl-transferase